MALYVNLSDTGTGHAGTSGDPFSGDEFVTLFSTDTYTEDDYYLRGSLDASGVTLDASSSGKQNCTFNAWDLELYGPWRVNVAAFLSTNLAIWRDGIIKNNTYVSSINFGTFYNCYLISTFVPYGCHYYGCTIEDVFDTGTKEWAGSHGSDFQDCTLHIVNTITASYGVTLTNCAVDSSSGSIGSTFTFLSCQEDWVAPTLPAWDADQSAFNVTTLFADVDTPPQPGNSPYTNYTTDLWGNARTGIGAGYMVSSTPPVWAATYPKAGTVAGTTAEILAETDQDGTAYYVTLADGASAPSSAEVKAGTGASGAAAVDSGSVALTADTEASVISTGLTSETAYDIYVVAENGSSDLQASPSLINVTTTDVTAPSWIATYPKATNITSSTVTMLLKLDDSGIVYYVTKDHGTAAPTAAAVKASPDGSTAVVANTEKSLSIVGLGYNKSYDIYLVAEDSNLVLQATPANVEVTTAQSNPPAMSPDAFIGMPPKAGNTGGNLQHSDTKLGNPLGNKNDNSAGDNKADGTEHGLPMRTVRGGGGGTVGISSRPSWLH